MRIRAGAPCQFVAKLDIARIAWCWGLKRTTFAILSRTAHVDDRVVACYRSSMLQYSHSGAIAKILSIPFYSQGYIAACYPIFNIPIHDKHDAMGCMPQYSMVAVIYHCCIVHMYVYTRVHVYSYRSCNARVYVPVLEYSWQCMVSSGFWLWPNAVSFVNQVN